MIGVILAGGSGTRFWPLSRETTPKQLLEVGQTGTLLRNTFLRLTPLIDPGSIYLVTGEKHAEASYRELAGLGFLPENLLAEPAGRNTGPALAYALACLRKRHAGEVMAVFPADHHIGDAASFHAALERGARAAQAGHLVTLGVSPCRAETGYGYIQRGEPLAGVEGAFRAARFKEKPALKEAEAFLAAKDHFWNAGIFLWRVDRLAEEFAAHLPDLFASLDALAESAVARARGVPWLELSGAGRERFLAFPPVSIDHGLMEKSSRVALVPAEFAWSDLGSWNALEDILEKDGEGNIVKGDALVIDSRDCIIQAEARLVAALGLEGLILVDTPDALMLCPRERAQEVRDIVHRLKKDARQEAEAPACVTRPWGSFTVLGRGPGYQVKRIEVTPGESLSLQSHEHHDETWTVVQGVADVRRDDEHHKLTAGETLRIAAGQKHRLGNSGGEHLVLIEVQTGERIDENDIRRYEDKYGRA